MRRSRFVIAGAALLVLATGLAYVVRLQRAAPVESGSRPVSYMPLSPVSPVHVAFEKEMIDLGRVRIPNDEKLEVNFILRNDEGEPVTVTDLEPSCSCTEILPPDGRVTPFAIAPGERVVLGLSTVLANRHGAQQFSLTVRTSKNGSQLPPLRAQVQLVLDSPLSAYPSHIQEARLEPNAAVDFRVVLADDTESSPIRIVDVGVSNPSVLSTRVSETDELLKQGDTYTLQGRYELRVTLQTGSEARQRRELIRIELSDGRTLELPITWRVALPIEVTPAELLVSRGSRAVPETRPFLLVVRDPPEEDFDAVELPEGVELKVEGRNAHLIRFSLRISSDPAVAAAAGPSRIVLAGTKSGRQVVIPLRVLP